MFLPLDVNFMDDPLITACGEQPGWLYVAMCLKAKALLSDGVLTEPQVEKLAVKDWRKRLDRLLQVADRDGKTLVIDITDANDPVRRYWISGWDSHNDRAETVDERRAKDAARKKRERESVGSPFGRVSGVPTESERRVEKSKEEKSRPSISWDVSMADHTAESCDDRRFCIYHRADSA